MKRKNRIISIISCILLIMATPSQVLAADIAHPCNRAYYSKENNTEVVIEEGASNMPQEYIDQIANENPNTKIIISNYVTAPPEISPRLIMGAEITSKSITRSRYISKNVFITSVAKGSKLTLGTKFTASLSASVTHKQAKTALGLNSKITLTISATKSFSGPPESSQYNSREYRVKFYAEDGTYKGYYITDMGRGSSISGSFTNPLDYAEYSVDKRV